MGDGTRKTTLCLFATWLAVVGGLAYHVSLVSRAPLPDGIEESLDLAKRAPSRVARRLVVVPVRACLSKSAFDAAVSDEYVSVTLEKSKRFKKRFAGPGRTEGTVLTVNDNHGGASAWGSCRGALEAIAADGTLAGDGGLRGAGDPGVFAIYVVSAENAASFAAAAAAADGASRGETGAEGGLFAGYAGERAALFATAGRSAVWAARPDDKVVRGGGDAGGVSAAARAGLPTGAEFSAVDAHFLDAARAGRGGWDPLPGGYAVTLSLVVAGSGAGEDDRSWDVEAIVARGVGRLADAVSRAGIAVSIDSQIILRGDSGVQPRPAINYARAALHTDPAAASAGDSTGSAGLESDPLYTDYHAVRESQLGSFAEPSKWGLDASAGSHTGSNLHLIAFVPSPEHRPLRVEPRKGAANATSGAAGEPILGFAVPEWGAVRFVNDPDRELSGPGIDTLSRTLVRQLRELLWLPNHRSEIKAIAAGRAAAREPPVLVRMAKSPVGVTGWEIDMLTEASALALASRAGSNLDSLHRMVEKMPNVVVPDRVAERASRGLDQLREAIDALAVGRIGDGQRAASAALASATEAFSDRALLAVLYFPDEHKFAVYMPLVLPLVVPILRNILAAIRGRGKKKKKDM